MLPMPNDAVVHLIDDDDAMRDSLAFLLNSARIEVRSYESAQMFLDALPHAEPGCIVTDVRMPGISGLDLLRLLGNHRANYPVIVITGHGDVPLAVEAMKLGAMEFLEKPFEDNALLNAVRSALGRHERDARRTAEVNDIHRRLATLSNRERQVLDGLVAGHPNKTIGYDLGISPRTVEIYRANVMTKMGASSLSDLVRMALIAGVIAKTASPGRSTAS
jgi:two-component system response regulator FixJ